MKRIIAGISVLLLVAVGVGIIMWLEPEREPPVAKARREPSAEMLKQRGPRPTESRLRDGAQQIEDPASGLELAHQSLERIDKEIAAARTDEERKRLEKKRTLIEQAIARLQDGDRGQP